MLKVSYYVYTHSNADDMKKPNVVNIPSPAGSPAVNINKGGRGMAVLMAWWHSGKRRVFPAEISSLHAYSGVNCNDNIPQHHHSNSVFYY